MLNRNIPPGIKPFTEIDLPPYNTYFLSNGIKIKAVSSGTQDVSRIDIIMNSGQCEEQKCALASMTLKSLAKGTASHSETEIAEILDFYGAWIDYGQADHNSLVSIYFTNKNFKEPLRILKEIITEPSFPENEIEILKKQTAELIKSQNKKSRIIAVKEFNKIMFGESHPLGKEINEKSIMDIKRNDIILFHRNLISSPLSITLSGKINSEILSYTSELFSEIDFPQEAPIHFSYKINSSPSGIFTINKEDAIQATVLSGQIAPDRNDNDYIPLRILTELFGGFFGSRLNHNIRESKGLTYGISAGLLGRIDISYMQIVTDCDNKYVSQVISEIKNEMRKLHKVKVDDNELNILKSYLLSEYAKLIDSPFAIASFINNEQLYGFPEDYLKKQINITKSINAEQLKYIANRYLNPDNFFTVIVGNENMIKI